MYSQFRKILGSIIKLQDTMQQNLIRHEKLLFPLHLYGYQNKLKIWIWKKIITWITSFNKFQEMQKLHIKAR